MLKTLTYVCLGAVICVTTLLADAAYGGVSGAVVKGTTWVVTSTADSGPGTLRGRLASAANGDTVSFDSMVFPPSSPATIFLNSALPAVTQGNITIDASNAGVILDGTVAIPGTVGLLVDSDHNTIKGLQILYFPAGGIRLTSLADTNTVGGSRTVGSGPTGEANVISANGGQGGLEIFGSDNVVSGNLIGTDVSGLVGMGNADVGVYVSDGSGNCIGPDNIIAHNGGFGVEIYGVSATGNTITQNSTSQNAEGGIRLTAGGNAGLAAPAITACSDTSVSGTAPATCTVEIFSDLADEGKVYEGTTTSGGSGGFTFTKPGGLTGPFITVTATDSAGNTSEFSPAASAAAEPTTWSRIKAGFMK